MCIYIIYTHIYLYIYIYNVTKHSNSLLWQITDRGAGGPGEEEHHVPLTQTGGTNLTVWYMEQKHSLSPAKNYF